MDGLNCIGKRAKAAAYSMKLLGQTEKNKGLHKAAECLRERAREILESNYLDVQEAERKGMKASLVDRLRLTDERIHSMAEGLMQIEALEDPTGDILYGKKRPNGLMIGKKRVPLGVVGIIYESRPNVTADAFGLCFKTGNAVILRGGSDAIHSNKKIVQILREALKEEGLPEDAILLIEDTSRDTATKFMGMNEYVDVLIPRGGAGLIQSVVQNSTIPVIETGTGNCHIYIDETADLDMAVKIVVNGKTQRLGVCNACESLVVHQKIGEEAVYAICKALEDKGVEIRGCERTKDIYPSSSLALEEDYGTEYLDAIISVKMVDSIEEAIFHINKYNTGHSEAIVTNNYANARKFLDEIDAAVVYVNASTRFTDGYEFGFGAEMGISTQKLHVRGPMGLEALTTMKYVIEGDGQIR